MTETLPLAKITPKLRGLMRLHGWLLLVWVFCLGYASHVLFAKLNLFQLLPLRVAVIALIMYGLGFIFGIWVCVQWWRKRAAADATAEFRASSREENLYISEKRDRDERLKVASGALDSLNLPEFLWPLAVILAPIFIYGAAVWIGFLPLLFTEALGALIAELVFEYVLAHTLIRSAGNLSADNFTVGGLLNKTLPVFALLLILGAVIYFAVTLNFSLI
jgi:hypothetical protein